MTCELTPWTPSIEIANARCVPVICESTDAVSLAAKSVAVNCWPGKMSTAAARPLRYAGSEIAPTSTSFCGRVVGAYMELARHERARRAGRNELLRDEHRRRGVLAADARAVAIEVDDEQDRSEHDGADAEGDRPSARRHPARDLAGERCIGHGFLSLLPCRAAPISARSADYMSVGVDKEDHSTRTATHGSKFTPGLQMTPLGVAIGLGMA